MQWQTTLRLQRHKWPSLAEWGCRRKDRHDERSRAPQTCHRPLDVCRDEVERTSVTLADFPLARTLAVKDIEQRRQDTARKPTSTVSGQIRKDT